LSGYGGFQMRIIFVGSTLLADGYRMAGVEPVPVATPDEMLSEIQPLLRREDAGIILLDYDFSSKIKGDLDKLRSKRAMPILVEVPGRHLSAEVDLKSTLSKIMGVKM
jgi:V/A-type H+-transporting ATPase subunit F